MYVLKGQEHNFVAAILEVSGESQDGSTDSMIQSRRGRETGACRGSVVGIRDAQVILSVCESRCDEEA